MWDSIRAFSRDTPYQLPNSPSRHDARAVDSLWPSPGRLGHCAGEFRQSSAPDLAHSDRHVLETHLGDEDRTRLVCRMDGDELRWSEASPLGYATPPQRAVVSVIPFRAPQKSLQRSLSKPHQSSRNLASHRHLSLLFENGRSNLSGTLPRL